MDNHCHSNILGFVALIPNARVAAAFSIAGPGRHDPCHQQKVEDVCFSFSGNTLWSQNEEELRPRCAEKPVHNIPWLPQEMITWTAALFTFYM